MRRLLLAFVFVLSPAFAQTPTCNQFFGTLFSPDAARVSSGEIIAQLLSGVNNVIGTPIKIPVIAGTYRPCLVPGNYRVTTSVTTGSGKDFKITNQTVIWQVSSTQGVFNIVYPPDSVINYTQGPVGPPGIQWYGPFTFASSVTWTVPWSFNTIGLVAICTNGVAECGSVHVHTSGTVTTVSIINSLAASGTVYIGSGAASVISFASANSITVTPLQLQNPFPSQVACYSSAGVQFGAGAITTTPFDSGIGGPQALNYLLALGSTAVTGYCVFI